MKSTMFFDFIINKENKSIQIIREFKAGLQLVWDAWSKPELLNQWWAPKPYHIETKSLDFKEGGRWLYAMVSPDNEKQWCKADYHLIRQLKQIDWEDAFCDENGESNTGKPASFWKIIFSEENGTTTVHVTLTHHKQADLEEMIDMGFKDGFTMGLQNLEDLLKELTASH